MKAHRIAVLALLLALPLLGKAQQQVTLRGTVKDKEGAVAPGVKISVAKVERSGMTDDAGSFSIPELKPGRYTVIVAGVGWKTETIADLEIGNGGAVITIVLEPATLEMQVYQEWEASWNEAYSQFLTAMREPNFCSKSPTATGEAYRFLWLRSFDNPILVKLDLLSDGTGIVETKVLSGQGGYEPGVLKESKKRKIPKEMVEWFRGIVDSDVKFWNLPAAVHDPNVIGLDGAMWITEARRGGKCHAVKQWSPETSPYRGLGLTFLLDLAELKLLYREVY